MGKGSLIDHIYVNSLKSLKNVGININDITDHYPLFFVIKTNVNRFNALEITYRRDMRNFSPHCFNEDIRINFEMNESRHSAMNEKFELLHEIIIKSIDKNAPKRGLTKKELSAGYKSWFTSDLTQRINEKNHLYFLIQKKNKTELINEYKEKSKSIAKDLEKAEKDYHDAEFLKHKNDMKQTWRLINSIINRRKNRITIIKKMQTENGKIVTNEEQICNILNQHFVTNGPKLAKNCPERMLTQELIFPTELLILFL